jgi:hypothetical protein
MEIQIHYIKLLLPTTTKLSKYTTKTKRIALFQN